MKLAERHWQRTGKFDKIRLDNQPAPQRVREFTDIAYVEDGHKYHLLDVYRPENAEGKLPVIFDIHGGGWYYGDKELNKKYCMHLSLSGFAVVNISYRLAPEASFDKQVSDCFAALNWLNQNADKYGLDIKNVFLTGDSAGGHLAGIVLNILADEKLQKLFDVRSDIKIKAVGFTCPAFDISKACRIPGAGLLYFRPIIGKGYRRSKYFKAADFTAHISDKLPPCFIVTAYKDFLRKGVLKGYEKLKEKGVAVELVYYDKPTPSGNVLGHVFSVSQPWWEESKEVNKKMVDFFGKYID